MKWSGSTCNVNIEGLSLRNKKDRPLRKRFIYQKKSGIYSLYSSSNSSNLILLLQKYILYTDIPPLLFSLFSSPCQQANLRLVEFICLRANSRRGKTLCMCRRAEKKLRAKIISYYLKIHLYTNLFKQ